MTHREWNLQKGTRISLANRLEPPEAQIDGDRVVLKQSATAIEMASRSLGLCALLLSGATGFHGVAVRSLPPRPAAAGYIRSRGATTVAEVAPLSATTEALSAVHAAAPPLASSLHTATAGMLAQTEGEVVGLLGNEFTWVIIFSMVTVAINAVFDDAVHAAKKYFPEAYLPVLQKILGELTTLGFVNLVFQEAQNGGELTLFLNAQSERFLGKPGTIVEILDSISPAIFPLTIAYGATCAGLLYSLATKFSTYSRFSSNELLRIKLAKDEVRAGCAIDYDNPTLGGLSFSCANAVKRSGTRGGVLLTSMKMSAGGSGRAARDPLKLAWSKITQSAADEQAEFLRFRSRFIVQAGLKDDFKFAMYLTECAVENLENLVSMDVSKLGRVWLPLICVETGLITAAGGGQGETMLPLVVALSQLPIAVWGAWNYARLQNIKSMLVPQLASSRLPVPSYMDEAEQYFKLLPPRYSLFGGKRHKTWWDRAYDRLAVIEQLYVASVPRERTAVVFRHDELFGKLGQAGPEFYMDSMKLVLYAATVSSGFFAAGGVDDLAHGVAESLVGAAGEVAVGAAQHALTLAALTPSICVLVSTPSTFLAYNWGTSIEGLRRDTLVEKLESEQWTGRFLVMLASLARLCEWVELALEAGDRDGTLGPRRTEEQVEADWQALLATTSPWTLLDVRALFESVDDDASGTLEIDEVEAIVRQCGYTPSTRALTALFTHMDADCSDTVRFREFATVLVQPSAEEGLVSRDERFDADTVAQLFRFFDKDGNGQVAKDEMLGRLGALGFEERGALQLFYEMRGIAQNVVSRQVFTAYLVDKNVAIA